MAEEGGVGVPVKRTLINKSLLLFVCVWVFVCYIHKEGFE